MSETTVRKYKFFWADQDVEQEQWLREMARQGLHLTGVFITQWTFVKGEPADVVYRVDYSNKGRDSDYNRLLEDAGWECAATTAGWHYWRKRVVDGKAPEIFTDSASKIERFRTVLAILIGVSMPSVIFLPKALAELPTRVPILIGALVAILIYSAIRLLLRIGRLRQKA